MTENAKVRPLMEQQRQQIEKRLQATMLLRKQIETLPSNTPQDIERKTKMLENVEDQTKRLRYAADMLLAATWEAKSEKERETALNSVLAEVEYKFKDLHTDDLERDSQSRLREAGIQSRFHWSLEFPEVLVDRGGFDAFVSNPPFKGGSMLEAEFGKDWRAWLVTHIAEGKTGVRGTGDLCAYFLTRSAHLTRHGAAIGLIATNTISQGDTREIGLQQLTARGFAIYRAAANRPWPGSASLEVSLINVFKGTWQGRYLIDGQEVPGISGHLSSTDQATDEPFVLKADSAMAIKGVTIQGMGFVMDETEAKSLITLSEKNRDVLFPYLNGDDLNSDYRQQPSRWAINFFDWPLSREGTLGDVGHPCASDYPECLQIVEQRVKPERMNLDADSSWNNSLRNKWWQYGLWRPALREMLQGKSRILVKARVSSMHCLAFVPICYVFSDQVMVFAFDDWNSFSVMQSDFHRVWAEHYGSTLESRPRYTKVRCFDTFVRPAAFNAVAEAGEQYYQARQAIMLKRQEGLTKTYNRFHSPDEVSTEIHQLRDLHVEMDRAVAAAYGWSDLDLGHGFHETKQGIRFTISEAARREVLARLLKLNHERYAEEVAQGLHDKGKGKAKTAGRKGKKASSSDEKLLF
jgi:hypothetical protein